MCLMSRTISGIKVHRVITEAFKCECDKLISALNKIKLFDFEYWNSNIENTLSLKFYNFDKNKRFDSVKADECA